jgi:hypothetical protein
VFCGGRTGSGGSHVLGEGSAGAGHDDEFLGAVTLV